MTAIMKKITKRDVLFFFLGLLTFLMLELIFDWEGSKEAFLRGWNGVPTVTTE